MIRIGLSWFALQIAMATVATAQNPPIVIGLGGTLGGSYTYYNRKVTVGTGAPITLTSNTTITVYGGSITVNSPLVGSGTNAGPAHDGDWDDVMNPFPSAGGSGTAGKSLTLRAFPQQSGTPADVFKVVLNKSVTLTGGEGTRGGNGAPGRVYFDDPDCVAEPAQDGAFGGAGGAGGALVIEASQGISIANNVTISTNGGAGKNGGNGGEGAQAVPPGDEDNGILKTSQDGGSPGLPGAGGPAGDITLTQTGALYAVTLGTTVRMLQQGGTGGNGGNGGSAQYGVGMSGATGIGGGNGGDLAITSAGTVSLNDLLVGTNSGKGGNGGSGGLSGFCVTRSTDGCFGLYDPAFDDESGDGGSGGAGAPLSSTSGNVTIRGGGTVTGTGVEITTSGPEGANGGGGGANGLFQHCPPWPDPCDPLVVYLSGIGGDGGPASASGLVEIASTSGSLSLIGCTITTSAGNGGNGGNGGTKVPNRPAGCPANGGIGGGGAMATSITLAAFSTLNASDSNFFLHGGNGGGGGDGYTGGSGGAGGAPAGVTITAGSLLDDGTTYNDGGSAGPAGTSLGCP